MTVRHRLVNRVFGWRVLHAAWLWVLVRIGVIVFLFLSAMYSGRPFVFPDGIDMAIVIAAFVVVADWVDERRFSLGILYANLGYSTASIRLLATSVALVAETALNAFLLIRG